MHIVTILNGPSPSLKEAQRLVGGFVERIVLPTNDLMLIDEEGLLKHLEVNTTASRIAGHTIVGPAIILQGTARKDWR